MSNPAPDAIALIPVNDELSVAPQLYPNQMQAAFASGFRSVINTRPDGEAGPEQPSSASIEAAARAAGLSYVYIPISPTTQTDADIQAMKASLKVLPRPILGFCRSGNRMKRLYDLAKTST